jgi:ketosteroid isomerase-like protein
VDEDFARAFASDWIEAWNRRDLDAVLAHYTDDFELSSPVIIDVAGEPSGTLRGKPAIREYWTKALARLPDLHFELNEVLTGIDTITIYYRGPRGASAETFHFDRNGKVSQALACYAPARQKVSPAVPRP